MARRNLRIVLWSALTHRLQTWADLARRQAEKARLAAERPADEQPANDAVERQPGEPPAHWLERAGRNGPPDHWLERVRERAPHLLDGDQLQVEPFVAAQPPAPAQPAPGRQPKAAQSAVPRTGPLRLIPRVKPAEEPAMEKPTVEELATKEFLAAPVAREQRSKKQAPTIRLEPQPTAELAPAPGQKTRPAPIESQVAPLPPLPVPSKKEVVTPQPPASQPPIHTRRPVSEPDQKDAVPRLEAEGLARPLPPIPTQETSPQSPPREPQPSAPDLTTPQSLPSKREQIRDHTEPVRWTEFKAEHIPAPPIATPEQQPQEEISQPGPSPVKVTRWPRKEAPVKDRWPALLDEEPSAADDWEASQRAWQRLQRLEREQRGHLWNESLS